MCFKKKPKEQQNTDKFILQSSGFLVQLLTFAILIHKIVEPNYPAPLRIFTICTSLVNISFNLFHYIFKGVMNLPGRPAAAFDPEGLIFAAGINSECIKLYDLRSFDKVSQGEGCIISDFQLFVTLTGLECKMGRPIN